MITVTMAFESLDREVDMSPKEPFEIADCALDRIVSLKMTNGDVYNGFFRGMGDNEDVLLRSLSSKNVIGIPLFYLAAYLEEIPEEEGK